MCSAEIGSNLGYKYIYRVGIERMDIVSVDMNDDLTSAFTLRDENGLQFIYDESLAYDTRRQAIIALIKQLITELQ
jgi:hypothetical protein